MLLSEFVEKTFEKNNDYPFRTRIVCVDGFSFSVQGSRTHYATPRKNQNWYTEMEIGFPSQDEELIKSYAENDADLTETVYGYVPCNLIQDVITKHGGIDIEETFKSK